MVVRSYKKYKRLIFFLIFFFLITGIIFLFSSKQERITQYKKINTTSGEIISGKFEENKFKTDSEWKKILTADQYHIMREAGTEIPFTGELNREKRKGIYYSIGCDKPIFRSEQKYDSGTGWPNFWAPINDDALVLRKEAFLDARIEVLDTCGNHLGHVFDDGPLPTGKRYCMNSRALRFVPDAAQ